MSPKEKISSNVESSHHLNCEIFENLLRCSIVCILSAQLITKNLWTAAVKWQTAQSRVLHQIPLLVLSCDHWWPSFCDLSKQQLIRTYCSIFYIISRKWKEWHLKFKTVKNIAVLVLLIPISYTSAKQQHNQKGQLTNGNRGTSFTWICWWYKHNFLVSKFVE